MSRAIILDRDGVINKNDKNYYVWKKDQLEFVDGIFENLRLLKQAGYKLFVVSNQGGISKGIYSKNEAVSLNKHIQDCLKMKQIELEDILFCPHHPEIEQCLCRKPSPLLIDRLISRYALDKSRTIFIGDSESDIQAANRAGIAGIRVKANQNMHPHILHLIV